MFGKLLSEIDNCQQQMITDRRDFHHYAESGWCEYRTSAVIIKRLKQMGYSVHIGTQAVNPEYAMGRPNEDYLKQQEKRAVDQGADIDIIREMNGYTGAVAILKTERPGPVIALRFEIDSNDLVESCSSEHRPFIEGFASVNHGFQHACGHDGHAAIGLACAQFLMRNKQYLNGEIRLLFQPAEEGVRGARSMVKAGWLEHVNYYLGGHIQKDPYGVIYCGTSGMLVTDKLDVDFIGKSAHAGACPQEGKNALLAACSATQALQSLTQDSRGLARVNVGIFQAGTGRNVIPDRTHLKIETRGETNEISTDVYRKTLHILNGAASMYDVLVKTSLAGSASGADSDLGFVEKISQILKDYRLGTDIRDIRRATGSDDAAEMMVAVQQQGGLASHFAWGASTKAPAHNSLFDFDERVLPLATKSLCAVVCTLCKEGCAKK